MRDTSLLDRYPVLAAKGVDMAGKSEMSLAIMDASFSCLGWPEAEHSRGMSNASNITKYQVDSKRFKSIMEVQNNYSEMVYIGVSQFLGAERGEDRQPNDAMIAFLLDTKALKATSSNE
jgi:hypothetical protein